MPIATFSLVDRARDWRCEDRSLSGRSIERAHATWRRAKYMSVDSMVARCVEVEGEVVCGAASKLVFCDRGGTATTESQAGYMYNVLVCR
jgi:hypothetical protein